VTKSIRMPSVEVPVADEVDVLVVGGGPAGVSAAFAAARMGAKTLLVEQFNCLGGVATAGGHGHICLYSSWGSSERVVGGVIYEMAARTTQAGYGTHNNSSSDFEVEGMKWVLERMAEECACGLLYHAFFAEALVEEGRVTGAVLQSKDGRQAVLAQRVVDCTGDGDVAARAGCAYDVGDEETGFCQPMTLMFTIGGVEREKVRAFQKDNYGLDHVWKKAQEDGFMRPFQSCIMGWWWTPTRPDQYGVNFTHINHADARKAAELTRATIEGRKQAYETIEVYRRYVPGMEKCYMISTPNTVGIRESRRIRGEYCLTKADLMAEREFPDTIGYGSFFIDIHNTKGPGMDAKTHRPQKGFKYQIPYRILVPRGVENLLVAGRCASTDHEALGSLRVMPQCGVMGQAAGVAAVLSLRAGVAPRQVDVKALQAALREQQGIVDAADVKRVNG
jgi:flavin-dependent dehydrogenase